MIVKANVNMGLSSLMAAKQRSLLALLGIVIGIGSVIAMVSIGIITREHSLKQFQELGTDYVVVSKGFGGSFGEKGPKITEEQAVELSDRVATVLQSSPMGSTGTALTYRGQSLSAQVIAVTGNFAEINRFKMAQGRFISDLDQTVPYCVVGSQLASQLKEKGATTVDGEIIKMQDRLFTIVGVLDPVQRGSLRPFDANRAIIIPYSTYSAIFKDPEVSNVIVRMKDGTSTEAITQDVINYFKLRDPALNIDVRTAQELITQFENQAQTFALLLTAIGSISLIVGGVGVMNVMLVSVTERRKEIGIRRALGALRRDIQLQFLIESLVLCFVGGLIGVVLGIGASYIVALNNKWEFIFSIRPILLGVGVSTVIGIFFGFYPARQAARLDPIVALRSE